MKAYDQLLLRNEAWANEKIAHDNSYFENLNTYHKPTFFWIGSSDGRVPESIITGAEPGEIFTHRNIANLVLPNDHLLHSALDYSIDHLKIKHIIICGVYACQGIKAAMETPVNDKHFPWVEELRRVKNLHQSELEKLDGEDKLNRLVELNVLAQCARLNESPSIIRTKESGRFLEIHGCVFSTKTGKIQELHSENNSI